MSDEAQNQPVEQAPEAPVQEAPAPAEQPEQPQQAPPNQPVDFNEVGDTDITFIDKPEEFTGRPLPEQPAEQPAEQPTTEEASTDQEEQETPEPSADQEEPQEQPAQEESPQPQESETYQSQEEMDTDFGDFLGHYTEGEVQSAQEFKQILTEYKELKNRPQGPEFTTDSAKKLFEFANQFGEAGLAVAKNRISALALDTQNMSDRDKIFSAYGLDEQNADLTPDRRNSLFNAEWDEVFQQAEEGDIRAQRKIELAARDADQYISKIQEDLTTQAAEQKSQDQQVDPQEQEKIEQEQQRVQQEVEKYMADFDGISIPAEVNGQTSELNFLVDSQEDRDLLQKAMVNPAQYINDHIVENFYDAKTEQMDWDSYQSWLTGVLFNDKTNSMMFREGYKAGEAAVVKGDLKKIPDQQTAPQNMPQKQQAPQSQADAELDGLGDAMKRAGWL